VGKDVEQILQLESMHDGSRWKQLAQIILRENHPWGKILTMKRVLSGMKYGAVVLGLAVLALMIIDFNDRLGEWRSLLAEKEVVQAEYDSLQATQHSYQTQIAYATSEAGVMEWAYRDGKWVREGEVLVVPVPVDPVTPTLQPQVVETVEPLSNWELWLSLFVDDTNP
jgi:hypothetical protein